MSSARRSSHRLLLPRASGCGQRDRAINVQLYALWRSAVAPPPLHRPLPAALTQIGHAVFSRRLRRLRATEGAAALLICGVLLAAGTTPANAAHAPSTTRAVDLETHLNDQGDTVRSVLVRASGYPGQCRSFIRGFSSDNPSVQNPYFQDSDWIHVKLNLRWATIYDVYSFSDNNCTDANFFIGSHGTINASVSTRWAVYNARTPKRVF